MTDRLTGIHLPGCDYAGIAEWGRCSKDDMLALIRRQAETMKRQADAILDATDDDFRITTYLGPLAMRNIEVIQEGKKP